MIKWSASTPGWNILGLRLSWPQNVDTLSLYHALKSQPKKSQNSYNTMTYDTLANKLLNTLGLPIIPVYDTHNTKDEINKIFKPIQIKCKTFYTSSILESEVHNLKQNCDSKLAIYSHIKTNYNYEPYLKSHPYNMYITKFRLSDHYLPIERGRYMKPKIPRPERTCTLCKSSVGDEIHALFLCKSVWYSLW